MTNMDQPDLELMKQAIDEATESTPRNERDPKVGAVVLLNDGTPRAAHRSELEEGDHAEFTLLQKKIRSTALLEGATLYTTLEPCTTRSHNKLPCADWVIEKRIRKSCHRNPRSQSKYSSALVRTDPPMLSRNDPPKL